MVDAKIYLKKQNENSPKLRAIFLKWVLIFCWGSIVADAEIYLSKGHEFWKWMSTIVLILDK